MIGIKFNPRHHKPYTGNRHAIAQGFVPLIVRHPLSVMPVFRSSIGVALHLLALKRRKPSHIAPSSRRQRQKNKINLQKSKNTGKL